MKRTIIAILLALALVVIPVSTAFAAKTATVTITATGGHLSIEITAGTPWDLGTVVEDETLDSAAARFNLHNNGSVIADVDISGEDTAVGGGGTPWALSEDGSNGADIYGMWFNTAAVWTAIPNDDAAPPDATDFIDDLAVDGNDTFALRVVTPTTITDIVNGQTITVTFTAAKS